MRFSEPLLTRTKGVSTGSLRSGNCWAHPLYLVTRSLRRFVIVKNIGRDYTQKKTLASMMRQKTLCSRNIRTASPKYMVCLNGSHTAVSILIIIRYQWPTRTEQKPSCHKSANLQNSGGKTNSGNRVWLNPECVHFPCRSTRYASCESSGPSIESPTRKQCSRRNMHQASSRRVPFV